MARYPYIAIEGVIGVGKTTLARLVRDSFQAELLLEVFEENPFLSDFYADRARYAFQTQMFFLLSRYRQQHRVIGPTLAHSCLISDYSFAKDRLFAHLNLAGDELEMYERVHNVLAEKIPMPDLVVYLRADVDTLMNRIATRDRPYERAMSRDYIADLRLAYERFFADYHDAPVLAIDTDSLNWVSDSEALGYVTGQVRATLDDGFEQQRLPIFPTDYLQSAETVAEGLLPAGRRRLGDFQRWQKALDRSDALLSDLYFNYMGLTQEVGQLGAEMTAIWRQQKVLYQQAGNQPEAMEQAVSECLPHLRSELADCLSYLLKLANNAGIDLETAFLEKVNR
ncbi:MAG: deoxynucleoside kinase [Anaerolineales bacterium]|nr:MAG: deoxynucleoside kinase [Anaerolineales bacterium]